MREAQHTRRVFPAYAGVFLAVDDNYVYVGGVPRIRGGVPCTVPTNF